MRFCLLYPCSEGVGDVGLRPRVAKFSKATQHAPKSQRRVDVRVHTRILGPRASGDFVLRSSRGGSPETISKKMKTARAFFPIIPAQRGRRPFRSASARRKLRQSGVVDRRVQFQKSLKPRMRFCLLYPCKDRLGAVVLLPRAAESGPSGVADRRKKFQKR